MINVYLGWEVISRRRGGAMDTIVNVNAKRIVHVGHQTYVGLITYGCFRKKYHRIWAWQMKNAAVAWQNARSSFGCIGRCKSLFYCNISALTATASYGLGGWGFESLWVHGFIWRRGSQILSCDPLSHAPTQ